MEIMTISQGQFQVEQFGDKARQARLRWSEHVQRRESGYTGRRILNMDLRENLWTEEEAEADDWLRRKMLVVFLNDYYLKKCTLGSYVDVLLVLSLGSSAGVHLK